MDTRIAGCLCASIASVVVAGSSLAAPIAVEDFGGYVTLEASLTGLAGRIVPNAFDGNPVGGQAVPNTAVSGIYNWTSTNAWGANRVVEGDLAYPGYISSGGKHFQAYSGGTVARATMDATAPTVFADYIANGVAVPAIGKTGTTLYMSFLFKIAGTTTASSQAVFTFAEQDATGALASRYEFGQVWNSPNITAGGTVLEPVNESTHLVVMKIVYNGTTTDSTDALTLWYDPNLSLAEGAQTIDATSIRNMTFTHLTFNGQGTASNANTKLDVDDLRFGTSWADVVPVPEPSIGMLLGSSALLLVRRWRQK